MLRFKLAELCREGEVDDHGDTFTCATPLHLNKEAVGEIANGWGDDEDFFRFRLREPRTVEIQSGGFADTVGELYDRYGNRLGRASVTHGLNTSRSSPFASLRTQRRTREYRFMPRTVRGK